jgi:Flp pilus assembly protein TadG
VITRRIRVAVALRSFARKPRGQVFVTISLALAVLMGISALAVDVGDLWTTRRLMQNAADAAAMAGADAVAIGDTKAQVTTAAKAASAQNGFTDGSGTLASSSHVTVTVYEPPQSGPYATNPNAVQVVVSQTQPTYFIRVLGWQNVPVSTVAVGLTVSGGSCVYALDPTASGTISIAGTGTLNSTCGMYDNSNNSSALIVSGGGILQAPLVGVVGGTTINGGGSSPPSTGIAAFGDPLAWVTQPTVGQCTSYHVLNIGTPTPPFTTTTLYPGPYCGGLKLNAGANVTFMPGTYIINGGGLTILSNATVTGSSVTFFLTGQNTSNGSPNAYGGVQIAGGANINLSAPCNSSSGGIEGMLFFEDRAMTNGAGSVINGGSASYFSGAIYFPTTSLSYSGNSGSNQYTLVVADTLSVAGTASINNNYSCLSNGSLIKNAALAQ